jgi:hypothetical protein
MAITQKKEDDAMAQSMTPSEMTVGQIGKVQELVGAGLRKANLPSGPAQKVLETQGDAIVTEFVASFRRRVEAISDMIILHVQVDRTRTPQQILDTTGRTQYTDHNVVDSMPRGEGDEDDVYFFKVGRFISDADLKKEYKLRGLVPADPYAQAQVNIDDPAFADEHPNGTHWKDADGRWCFASFYQWLVGRGVLVDRNDGGWNDDWWFAGVRK